MFVLKFTSRRDVACYVSTARKPQYEHLKWGTNFSKVPKTPTLVYLNVYMFPPKIVNGEKISVIYN